MAAYEALECLYESIEGYKPPELNTKNASMDDLLQYSIIGNISLTFLYQRFLEGDEERYLFETL
jgi:hypothetical protein